MKSQLSSLSTFKMFTTKLKKPSANFSELEAKLTRPAAVDPQHLKVEVAD